MKVREEIIIEGWVNCSGFSYSEIFDTNIIEASEADLTAESIDWSWWDTEDIMRDVDDIHIIVVWYSIDDDSTPLAKWDTWHSELKEA